MKKDIKNSLKIFTSYILILVLFTMFVPIILNISKDNTVPFLVVYSFLLFLMLFSMIYSDTHKIASIERKPASEAKAYPLKGFVLGVLGFLPITILGMVYPFINTVTFPFIKIDPVLLDRLKHVALNTVLSPFYFIIKAGNESVPAYIAAFLMVPVITAIGYYCGYKGYELSRLFKKDNRQNLKK